MDHITTLLNGMDTWQIVLLSLLGIGTFLFGLIVFICHCFNVGSMDLEFGTWPEPKDQDEYASHPGQHTRMEAGK